MACEKENKYGSGRRLLIFSDHMCLRRILPKGLSGKQRLHLERSDTGLLSDVELEVEEEKDGCKIGGKSFDETAPFYFYTEKQERLLLLLSPQTKYLEPSGRIYLKEGEYIKLGNAYPNQIFYQCFSLVDEIHAEVFRNQYGYSIVSRKGQGIYVNGRKLQGTQSLIPGDCIELYGLHLLVLKEFLIGISFCGTCRIAEGKEALKSFIPPVIVVEEQANRIERRYEKDEALHQGEMELMMPDTIADRPVQPFWLSNGPMLTMVLPMLIMAQLSSQSMKAVPGGVSGMQGSNFYYASVVMSICTAVLALFWGIVGQGYHRHFYKREKREKERQYRNYLEEIKEELLRCQEENRSILERRYPALLEHTEKGEGVPLVLWNRYYRQKDFLFIRLGIGRTDFQIKIKKSGATHGISKSCLVQEAEEIAEQFQVLDQVPVGVDLFVNRQIGVLSDGTEVLLQLVMQIAICHCYTEVKIACFYNREKTYHRKIAECLRWLPHIWSVNRRVRFLAGDEREAAEILPVLTKELGKRCEQKEEGIQIPWYVAVVLDEELLIGEPLYRYLTDSKANCPVSTLFVGKERKELPKSCRYFVIKKEQKDEILDLSKEQVVRQSLMLETCNALWAQRCGRQMTGIRLPEREEEGQLPEKVGFLELYGCNVVEELGCDRRWRLARTEERMKAPIGCRSDGHCISLDINERFHGPHGLVAGTTGSGKSELLQTYLLSMAVSYSPADVNFFMIDYKGGGTGNVLMNLPHCAGVISNLSGKQIKRAMSAISSENQRRQRLLGEFQVNHIDAYVRLYREGKALQPMPHLILVVDEFAELKREEPEFMQEIISLAQVGRSLGVHLILATQKPAGTVDDKIWSNAKFRMCLKVQDAQDSMDMLKNRDAAMLTVPGQCYLQIGTNEYYELFQAGYCGGVYHEGGDAVSRVALLSNTGKRTVCDVKYEDKEEMTLMATLVSYVNLVAAQHNYKRADQLWMEELPEMISVDELRQRDTSISGAADSCEQLKPNVIVGLCDDPAHQRQRVLYYHPVSQGHMAVGGGPGTGKTTLLQTLLWQLCERYTPDQVQVLVAAMGQTSNMCFQDMPGCLCVLTEKENKDVFFYHLKKLMAERKEKLSGISCEQHNRSGNDQIPYLFLVIDGYGTLRRELNEEQEELILKLAAEGLTLGVYLILSVAGINEMGGRLFDKIKTTVSLEMSDRFQYGDILRQYHISVLPKENCKGRGLCKMEGSVLEFQVPLALEETEEYKRICRISEAGAQWKALYKRKGVQLPDKFPVLPKKPDFEMLADSFDWNRKRLPLGYCLETGTLCSISTEEAVCFLIVGNGRTGKKTLLCCLIESFIRMGKEAVILDTGKSLGQFAVKKGVTYLKDESEIRDWKKTGEKRVGIFISDMGSFCSLIYQFGEGRMKRADYWEQLAAGKKEDCFFAGIYHTSRDVEAAGTEFLRKCGAWQYGICLGGNLSSQRVLHYDDVSYARQNQYEPPGIGYLREGPGSISRRLLLPVIKMEKKKGDETGNDTN